MAITALVGTVASDFLLATMARAEYISKRKEINSFEKVDEDEEKNLITKSNKSYQSTHEKDNKSSEAEQNELNAEHFSITESPPSSFSSTDSRPDEGESLIVGEHKIDLPELCQIFLGEWGFNAYAIAILCYSYGFLWAYASVFGSAMATVLPLGDIDSYPLYILLFALIVVPMSFLELSEQVTVQVFLSGCRFLMIFLMVGTPILAAFANRHGVAYFEDQLEPEGASLICVSGIKKMLSIVVFSALFHQNIPSLADEATDKSQLGTVFGITLVLCGVSYSFIGIIGAWYFGSGIEPSSNLNWAHFHGFGWLSTAISFYVVCFPAIDVVSAYPLNAFTLACNLMGIRYKEKIHEVKHDKQIRSFCKALSCLPPLFGALIERDLGLITDYTGLAGLAIGICFPALLFIFSERKMKDFGYPTVTYYKRFGSSTVSAYMVLAFGVSSIVFVFIALTCLK